MYVTYCYVLLCFRTDFLYMNATCMTQVSILPRNALAELELIG